MPVNTTKVTNEKSAQEIFLFNQFQLALNQGVVLPLLVTERSGNLRKGVKSVTDFEIANIGAPEDTKEDGNEQADSGFDLQLFEVLPTADEKFNSYIYDKAKTKSMNDYRAAFMIAGPYGLAKKIQSRFATAMLAAANTSLTLTGTDRNGDANKGLSLDDVQGLAQAMDDQELPQSDRIMCVRYKQKHDILKSAGLLDVSKAGTNSALAEAEFQRIYGFRMVSVGSDVLPSDGTAEVMAFHKSALIWEFIVAPTFEEERQASKSRDYLGMRQVYGFKINDRKDIAGNTPTRIWKLANG